MTYREKPSEAALGWPYPVDYGAEHEISTDVLVIGGGTSGYWTAISAARKGLKVTVVEKGGSVHSGSAASGVDHWQNAATNPASKVTPEELAQAVIDNRGGYDNGITRYIECRESYDTLLELEKMGMKIRDTEDEFKGAEFRDEETKLLFCYDYENRYSFRTWGTGMKPALYNECRRLGVEIYTRVMATSLLTEDGEQGVRVVGATGVNGRTGEFFIFKAKATVLCTAGPERVWISSTEQAGLLTSLAPPLLSGDGHVMAWRAGAEFTSMEASDPYYWGDQCGLGVAAYCTGTWRHTWFPCTLVDSNGKEIPWVDRDGKILKNVSERARPAPGQKFFLEGGGNYGIGPSLREFTPPRITPDFVKLTDSGEFTAPIYADLPSMPEYERRAIFGLMVGQEGKSWIGYRTLTQAGFDPNKDMLQCYPPLEQPRLRRIFGNPGGLVTNWDMRTNLEGLYVAGGAIFNGLGAARACCTGRYAGRKVAEYAVRARESVIDRKQIEDEKTRVYSLVKRKGGMEWKQLASGIAKVMQDYCGDVKNDDGLKIGLKWLKELRESEGSTLYARNPHQLVRALEVLNIITVGEMIIHASLARKASSIWLGLKRSDYPEIDPPEWYKWITTKLEDSEVKVGELPIDYWGPLKENYEAHCGL